ncbi:MAG: transcriptional repressor LexA [Myxococcota bacterium]|nr:transcriptional repressor LexA [Myxococcota bacterium]
MDKRLEPNLIASTTHPPQAQRLTARQAEVLASLENSIQTRGYPPTIRELGAELGIRSPQGVSDHLAALERKGYIQRTAWQSRSCVPVAMSDDTVEIPLYDGRVAAGQPALALNTQRETLRISRTLLRHAHNVFALEVQGDSMIGDGIHDGDVVFVERNKESYDCDIAVIRVEDSVTIKRRQRDADGLRLVSSNPDHEDIVIRAEDGRDVSVVGRVVGVYRALN